jgi:hypothetical protein
MYLRHLAFWLSIIGLGCEAQSPYSEKPDGGTFPGDDRDTNGHTEAPFEQTAGYISLASRQIAINFGGKYEGNTCESRVFYSLIPADNDAADMPLMVIFNGGPGSATTSNLFIFGMAPLWIDYWSDNWTLKNNPNSFTAIANLLFIDTNQSGFSYGILPNPALPAARKKENNFYNFGIFTDAGDTLLTILGVMELVPELRDNPVVLMGESYGGARISMVSRILEKPAGVLTPGADFYDPTLGTALQKHFETVIPAQSFDTLTRTQTAEQFGWQVLLQPAGMLSSMGYMQNVCEHLDSADPRKPYCEKNGNDVSFQADIRKPEGYFGLYDAALPNLVDPTIFEKLFGVAPKTISGLSAMDRVGAFRHEIQVPDKVFELWNEQMGTLPEYDSYHVNKVPITEMNIPGQQFVNITTPPFIRSLVHVNTFISNALYDGKVISDRMKTDIKASSDALDVSLIKEVRLDRQPREGVQRPGWMIIDFSVNAGLGEESTREIRMPTYANSGHMIPLNEAGELREDIENFLSESGAYR